MVDSINTWRKRITHNITTYVLKIWPLLACIISGIGIYLIHDRIPFIKDQFFLSISSSMFTAVVLYIAYELQTKWCSRQLRKSLSDYSDLRLYNTITSLLELISYLVIPIEMQSTPRNNIRRLLEWTKPQLQVFCEMSQYTGFQIHRSHNIKAESIIQLLDSPFIQTHLTDKQIKALVSLSRSVAKLIEIIEVPDFWKHNGACAPEEIYRIRHFTEQRVHTMEVTARDGLSIKRYYCFPDDCLDRIQYMYRIEQHHIDSFISILITVLESAKPLTTLDYINI